MTTKRRDNHSTEFGLWLRDQEAISSGNGFLATNLDFIWTNYTTKNWMMIEEKRYMSFPKPWQQKMFRAIDKAARSDINYRGFHLLMFEKTSPTDGRIFLNFTKNEITLNQLLEFLMFKKAYRPFFP